MQHYIVVLQPLLDTKCDWAMRHKLKLSLDKCFYLKLDYNYDTATNHIGKQTLYRLYQRMI